MIEWRFKPNQRDDMDVDPIQGEFFTTRDIDNISTAVVREGIQNALDERNRNGQNETVKVRIFLSGKKYALESAEYLPMIGTLRPHLSAKGSGISAAPDFNLLMSFLVFEDFNTNGLEGNPKESYVENTGDRKPHNFYYFWRNVGRSGKTDDKLGRWGLGKTVFPASSKINTFWGLTVRKSDQRKMLMGQSILRIHNLEGDRQRDCGYKPYGNYGDYNSEDFFAEPIEGMEELANFEKKFKLKRGQTSGLSLVIPFYTEEITKDHLAYSVVEQYFYPILEGRLEVEITNEDEEVILERMSIQDSIEKINFDLLTTGDDKKIKTKESLVRLFDFARWTLQLKDSDFFRLKESDLGLKPRWNKSLFEDETGLNGLRDKFESGERIAFKIPLKYHPVGGMAKTCWFNAFLEKDTSLSKPQNLFVRDGITISGITSLDKGLVRGVVIIQDMDLARMLGDSENPAHTEWQADSRNFKGKYIDGKESLSFVKGTLKNLFEKLQKPIQGMQKNMLIDFFSIPVESDIEKKQKDIPTDRKTGKDGVGTPDIVVKKRKPTAVFVQKIKSGVKIFSNPDAEGLPESLEIKFGYDVPRGNPIKKYQDLDFDVSKSPLSIDSSGVYFTKKEKNELEFNITDKTFEITLTGFDIRRDLLFKIS